ncbi:LpxL/LpxP family acyltransferase [Cupriavidus gilardii]|uniref:LpxL/LpxP family acyltransferase n=1 Tax=Cupriavidus gilardii TaxID=82541 RepID=UPI001573435E|nr:acyltransferase [Cupriavidus gilardii]NSX04374.1 acyltransferase [Cupriavidus gilardii]
MNTAAAGRRWSRHWADIAESTCVWGIWSLYAVNRIFGRTLFRVLLYPVVMYYWLTRPAARRASVDFLRRVHRYGGAAGAVPGLRHSLRHLLSFAETLLDKMLAISGRYRFDAVRRDGAELMARQRDSGRGAVIVTAHMGCLELCRVVSTHKAGLRVNVLVHTMHAERFNRILSRLDPQAVVQLIQVTEITPATALLLQQKIEAGEFVAIAGDRVPLEGGRSVTVSFLGAPARMPIGPYALAALLRCPLLAMSCVRAGDGHLLRFAQLAEAVVLPRGGRLQALTRHAQAYADWLAVQVCASPYEWFNFYDFWSGAGDGDAR